MVSSDVSEKKAGQAVFNPEPTLHRTPRGPEEFHSMEGGVVPRVLGCLGA